MTDQLVDWSRPHFVSGGGDPFLFYVAYGPVPNKFAISRNEYQCSGIPEGIELMGYGPNSNPDVPDSFRDGYLWNELVRENASLANSIKAQSECLIIRGGIADPENLNYFRDVVGLIQWLFDTGSTAIYDPQSFKWWTRKEWRDLAFESESGSPRHHVLILASDEADGEWLHTRGLRKFGRPDLSIRSVLPDRRSDVIDLLNRFIEFQALGGIIKEGESIRLPSLPDGMTCHHRGDLDDPDFNNVHVEIAWPK